MIPMMNMYETIRDNLHFNKFSVGELLFVEYKCPIEQEAVGLWTPMDYFVHVLSGKKTWRTTDGIGTAQQGQTLFFKKCAAVVYQDFKKDFCVMVFFVSDNFIRDVVREVSGQLSGRHEGGTLPKCRFTSSMERRWCSSRRRWVFAPGCRRDCARRTGW